LRLPCSFCGRDTGVAKQAKKAATKRAGEMTRKTSASRLSEKLADVKTTDSKQVAMVEEELPPAPEPSGCTAYVCERVAAALPKICKLLLNEVLDGATQAVRTAALKLLWQMALLDKQAGKSASDSEKSNGKGTAAEREFARRMLAEFRNR
jgi:hypothetical protein